MTAQWFRKEPSPEKIAVDQAAEVFVKARDRRKSLLAHVIQKIEDIPLDDSLIDLGTDLRGKPER